MSDVASSAWIAPGAHVGGAVRLGDDVSVWYGAAVRAEMAEIVIGARSNVQDNAVIHVDEGFGVQLGEGTDIALAWNSEPFEAFRAHLRRSCPSCAQRASCMGGCPLMPQIVLCDRAARTRG